jgi:segregation and condensation protein A
MILPREDGDAPEIEPSEMAANLAFRLQRLEAMRRAAQALFRLPLTGETVFPRGNPEGLRSKSSPLYEAEMFDLLKAYGESRSKAVFRNHKLPKPKVLSLSDARTRLRRAMSQSGLSAEHWVTLGGLLPQSKGGEDDVPQESIKASSLLASLEMAKDGEIFLRQDAAFSDIYLKSTGQDSRRKDIENQDP